MNQSISLVTLVVREYDEAIAFFTQALRFRLVADTPQPSGKRWVVVAPQGSKGTSLLLGKAANAGQLSHVGDQTGGRVFLFLETGDFWGSYRHMQACGVRFAEEPRKEPYGMVVVFFDLYGNKWDLLERERPAVAQGRLPQVGVGVIVQRDGRVLLGQRLSSHGAGTWALPGGHLEFGESIEECARREVLEETGLALQAVHPGPFTSDVFAADDKHYVTLFMLADSTSGEPMVREPGKCARWVWCRWSELPEPLFPPLATLCRTGFVPEDRQ